MFRRVIIEGNAKCRHLKTDFAAGVFLSEAQNPQNTGKRGKGSEMNQR
jgi:hypothetical protein